MWKLKSSLVAAQNGLAITPTTREPQKDAEARQQQEQRAATELPRSQVVVRQNNPEAFQQAERFREQKATAYEQPNARARNAINQYQSLATEQRRSEIQQLMGIDTYA